MDLEQKAIERIKLASQMSLRYYDKPLICTYSGGKDSDVMLELFIRSGVPFEAHNSHTTVDAPPTVYHIREVFKRLEEKGIKCTIQHPMHKEKPCTMWDLIVEKGMPPTRLARYCCQVLKESNCKNRMIATGVRWEESTKRKGRKDFEIITSNIKNAIRLSQEIILSNDNDEKRQFIERCELKAKSVCNPILDWGDSDIWEYIRSENIHYNPLYDMGYMRVGCVGCPMAGKKRYKEFADFPSYERAYIRAFDKMLEKIRSKGAKTKYKNGEELFKRWMEDENVKGQMSLFDIEGFDI